MRKINKGIDIARESLYNQEMSRKALALKWSKKDGLAAFQKHWSEAKHYVDIVIFDLTPNAAEAWDDVVGLCELVLIVDDTDPESHFARDEVIQMCKKQKKEYRVVCTKGNTYPTALKIPNIQSHSYDGALAKADVVGAFNYSTWYPNWKEELKGVKMVAIGNQKGGVGKTTVALSIARKFKDAGDTVIFCEVDKQAGAFLVARKIEDYKELFA